MLGVVAVAASLFPRVNQHDQTTEQPSLPAAPVSVRTIVVGFPQPRRLLPQAFAPREHVVVQVTTDTSGQASIPGLGETTTAEPGTPAVFDLVGPARGRFTVEFTPGTTGRPSRVGVLVAHA